GAGEKEEVKGWREAASAFSDHDPGAEERIAARRRRIAARLDAKRRKALGEDAEPKVAEKAKEQRRSQQQIEESRQRLAKLLFDGTQLVTNIQVAADMREMQRRTELAELKLQRVKKLEDEAKCSTDKFEEITSKWALAKELVIPQELWQLLKQQQQQCALLLEEKNKLLDELQQELQKKDEEYVQALKKQADDIQLLLERMEEQIMLMLKTYRQQLLQLEEAFELERRELLEKSRKKLEEAIQAHNAQELEYLHARMRKVEEVEKQLQQLRVQDEEDYNSMKLQLENEVETLEKQIQQMTAVYQLNQEKLEYNLSVLKKQDEENTLLRSQQKRRINRLHSFLNKLRSKLAKQEKQFGEEKQSLAVAYESLMEQCKEVERRMRHFAAVDAEKFTEVWLLNEEEAKKLMRKALAADHLIHRQQLALPWEEPSYWFLTNVGPLGYSKEKEKNNKATRLAAEVLAGEGEQYTEEVEDGVKPLRNIPKKTAERILQLLSEESGFLVASKRLKALQGLRRHKRTLLRLDSIFEALEIASEDDLSQLVDFFLKYKAQELDIKQVGSPRTALEGPMDPGKEGEGGGRYIVQLADLLLQSQASPGREDGKEDGGSGGQKDELKASRSLLGSLPSVFIHAEDVLKILKAFVRDFAKLREKDGSSKELQPVRDSSKDGEYWEALAHIIPEQKLKLWDALRVALQKY
ncbi:DRC1 protein, partial [Bucco capensis]|nr:DRC1 protein [Bucco capensis]